MQNTRRFGRRGQFRAHGGPGKRFNRPFGKNRFAGKYIDPKLFVREAQPIEVQEVEIKNQFSDFGLPAVIEKNLTDKGFVKPTPIQDMALPLAMQGEDVLGLAETGTGKTAAFLLPILAKMYKDNKQSALIIAPTRELAGQIRQELRTFSNGLPISSCLLIGGANMARQISDLRHRPNFLIGTPGRLKDLYTRKQLQLSNVKTVVLDEVDRMLDMGFIHDITQILSYVPQPRQTLLFSATIDRRVEDIAFRFMNKPTKIAIQASKASQNVDQDIVKTNGKPKLDVLCELLSQKDFQKVLVFGRTKHSVENLSKKLISFGYRAGSIHGNKRQNQRDNILRQFKSDQINILIATDVAARGIDVKDVTHVINFDQPNTYEDYIHRIGRTGRAGKMGKALTFID